MGNAETTNQGQKMNAGTTHINTGNGYHEHQGGASYVFVSPERAKAEEIQRETDAPPRTMYRRTIRVGGVAVLLYFVVELHRRSS